MNGAKKSSFCCHRDNISLHTLLAALWLIVGASPSPPFLCFSFSTGQDVSERVWGGGEASAGWSDSPRAEPEPALTLFNQWL